MADQQMTPKQADALSRFLTEMRSDWDRYGVHAQLGYARDRASAWDLAVAAIRAAQDHRNRTPAVIPLDGEHWRRPHAESTGPTRPPAPEEFCAICGRLQAQCERIAQLNDDGHVFQANTRHDGQLVDIKTGQVLAHPPTRTFREVATLADLLTTTEGEPA